MKSYILLENLVFHASHGVMPQEYVVGNVYVVNIKITTDLSKACISDNVSDTISYADVFEDIKKEMQIPSKLLENVAYRIMNRLKTKYSQIEHLEVKLSKRNPPMGGQIDFASVLLSD